MAGSAAAGVGDGDLLYPSQRRRWPGLRACCALCHAHACERTSRGPVTSFPPPPDAAHLARIVRSHWTIENSLHWVLDVALQQDETRIRTGHAPENLATLHHIALNLLKQERTEKLGIKNKRLPPAGITTTYCESSWPPRIRCDSPAA